MVATLPDGSTVLLDFDQPYDSCREDFAALRASVVARGAGVHDGKTRKYVRALKDQDEEAKMHSMQKEQDSPIRKNLRLTKAVQAALEKANAEASEAQEKAAIAHNRALELAQQCGDPGPSTGTVQTSTPRLVALRQTPAPPCFFYGTLMALPVLYRVCFSSPSPSADRTDHLYVRPAVLKDHRRRKVKYETYPGVIPYEGDQVPGTYVTGLSKADMRRLEDFEGGQYNLAPVKVNALVRRAAAGLGRDGKPTYTDEVWEEKSAMTYLFTAGMSGLTTKPWEFSDFMRNDAMNWACSSIELYDGQYDDLGFWKGATPTEANEA